MTLDAKQLYWNDLANAAGLLAVNFTKVAQSPVKLQGNVIDGGMLCGVGLMVGAYSYLSPRENPTSVEKVDAYLARNLLVNMSAEFLIFRKFGDWQDLTKEDITPEIIRLLNMVSHRRTFYEACEVSKSRQGDREQADSARAVETFLAQYNKGSTWRFYSGYLLKSFPPLTLSSSTIEIQDFINFRCGKEGIRPGGRHAYYRALRSFFNWAFSPASGLKLNPSDNPITWVKPPKVVHQIMPAQDEASLKLLLAHVKSTRDRAFVLVLSDSGGRLSEVSRIEENDILWERHVVKTLAKGGREVLLPLKSAATEALLRDWLKERGPGNGNIWGCKKSGLVSMLRRLEKETGVKCNAHTFRRGFASILRRKGVDSLDIMRLGHWKSLSMVQRYTESVAFEDSQKHYEAPTRALTEDVDFNNAGT